MTVYRPLIMRKILLAFTLVTLSFIASAVQAASDYVLFVPSEYMVEDYGTPLKQWKTSLIKNIGYQDDSIAQAIFLKSDIALIINNSVFHGLVYQNRLNQNQFYLARANVIVDFAEQKIGAMGKRGISVHTTPSKRMVVVLAPRKNESLLGVTIDMPSNIKGSMPIFESRKAAFKW